jgi:hypothetical protein
MAMGTRSRHAKQASMWVATQDLPRSAASLLRATEADSRAAWLRRIRRRTVRALLCGRRSARAATRALFPVAVDRLLRGVGRGARDRLAAADSFALREFVGLVWPEAPPDHSTISRTRRLGPPWAHLRWAITCAHPGATCGCAHPRGQFPRGARSLGRATPNLGCWHLNCSVARGATGSTAARGRVHWRESIFPHRERARPSTAVYRRSTGGDMPDSRAIRL